MTEVKLVLTDIDGTLVAPGTHEPSTAVREAIEEVHEAGITLTAATGRPYEMMQPLFEKLGFKDYGVFDAGASVRNVHTGELVWNNWLDADRVSAIAKILLPHAAIIDFYPDYKEVPPEEAEGDLRDIVAAPYVFGFLDGTARNDIVAALQTVPDISYHFGVGGPGIKPGYFDLQITDRGASKLHAVTALRKIVHSDKAQTLAIGDSTNDLPLFEAAGIKVAMGNAVDELKQRANYIVGDVEHDGFAEAMRHYVLP